MSYFDLNDIEINVANPLNLNVAVPELFTELLPYTNMLRIDTINEAGGDLRIYVNDTATQWSTGQTLRIAFNNGINIGSRNIRIFTDGSNRLNGGSYSLQAAVISNSELSADPIIELICTEQGILSFVYDVIK